jgi:heavy metal sensor kinase
MSLTLWYAGASLAALTAYAVGVFAFVSHSASKALDDRLRSDVRWVAEMADQNADGTLVWYEGGDDGSGETDSPWLQVWSPEGQLLLRSHAAEWTSIDESRAWGHNPDGEIHSVAGPTGMFRMLSMPSTIGKKPVVIQVAASEGPLRREVRSLTLILALGLPVGVVATGFGGYALARRALAPIDRMADRARTITAERLGERLPIDNPNDELGRLANVFNDTLGTLEASFEQMRRFTADVSHEIRTPLSAMRTVGEVGLLGRRDEAHYRGIIGSMLEDVDRLTCLVDGLLILSRAENERRKGSLEPIDVSQMATDIVTQLGVLAEEKGQSLTIESQGRELCLGDRLVLRQAVLNLVDNAIKYTPSDGNIHVRVSRRDARVVVDVIDSGPGIDEEHRERIFDRHYRGTSSDDSRGAGLGLSIARWAVEMNGGQLTVDSQSGLGSTFRIALPHADSGCPPDVLVS